MDNVRPSGTANWELSWEWRIAKNGNNGIKYFITEARKGALGTGRCAGAVHRALLPVATRRHRGARPVARRPPARPRRIPRRDQRHAGGLAADVGADALLAGTAASRAAQRVCRGVADRLALPVLGAYRGNWSFGLA